MLNKKGHVCMLVPVAASKLVLGAAIFQGVFAVIAAAAVWHIPAWTEAKKNHTEASYQAQPMWPQVQIAQFGNGNPSSGIVRVSSSKNGGNMPGGNSSGA